MNNLDRLKFRIRYKCGGCGSINTRYVDWCPIMPMIEHECEHCTGAAWVEEVLSQEQCTGLKDTNGVLIYEGDIIIYAMRDGIYEPIRPYGFIVYENCNFAVKSHLRYTSNQWLGSKQVFNIEVIGNIHDNPELLEAK